MSGRVWMSGLYGNISVGTRQGIREKNFGNPWTAAKHDQGFFPKNVFEAADRNSRGVPASRQDMPEAAAVWNSECFQRQKDILAVAGYYVITGELIDVFKDMDFGNGGLVELPFYEADLVTPLAQKFFMINVGACKDAFLPEASENKRRFMVDLETGQQLWNVNETKSDGVICLSDSALEGADLWVEVAVRKKIFMSDRLGSTLLQTRQAADWELLACKIVEAVS